jgi:hypothetical protein
MSCGCDQQINIEKTVAYLSSLTELISFVHWNSGVHINRQNRIPSATPGVNSPSLFHNGLAGREYNIICNEIECNVPVWMPVSPAKTLGT